MTSGPGDKTTCPQVRRFGLALAAGNIAILAMVVAIGLFDWRRPSGWLCGLLAAVALATILFSVALYRQGRDQWAVTCRLDALAREQQAMLDNQIVGMAKVRQRRFVWKNRAVSRVFGYGEAELEGQPTRCIYLDDASYERVGAADAALARGGWFRTQLRMRRKDGSPVWIDLNGVQLSPEESLWMMVDISVLKENEELARHVALHDALTHLPNRTLFAEQLDLILASGRRKETKTAVCLIDLDGFKPINDAHGHEAGDQVLAEAATRLRRCMRENDLVARLGGDEFALVLVDIASHAEMTQVLARVLGSLCAPIELESVGKVTVGASVGVAIAPDQAADARGLQRLADAALYRAKRQGRRRVHLAGLGLLCRAEEAEAGSSVVANEQAVVGRRPAFGRPASDFSERLSE